MTQQGSLGLCGGAGGEQHEGDVVVVHGRFATGVGDGEVSEPVVEQPHAVGFEPGSSRLVSQHHHIG